MARPPRLYAGDMHGAAEVVPVLGLGEPARLARGLAGRSASRRRTASSHTCAAALTSAILDRVLHHAETVIIEGKSFRMKDEIDE